MNRPLEEAKRYRDLGWAPIPAIAGQKAASVSGWQKLRLKDDKDLESYFRPDSNLGVLLGEASGGLIDVDLDTSESVRLAASFLPETLRSGRGGRCRHYWYTSPGVKSTTFTDTDGSVLLELRSDGGHTLVYPSKHPTGDSYEWNGSATTIPSTPSSIPSTDLKKRAAQLATACLIARHMPDSGRHDLALALAGYLLRKLDDTDVSDILQSAWSICNPSTDASKDLQDIVDNTRNRLDLDEPVVGGKTLDELIPGFAGKIASYFGWKSTAPSTRGGIEQTEVGNANRLVERHGHKFRYVIEWRKWIIWNGLRWEVDHVGQMIRYAEDTISSLWEEASKVDAETGKVIAKWAENSMHLRSLKNMVELAQSRDGVAIRTDQLDTHPDLLTCRSGTMDLRTMQLRKPSPDDYITRLADVEWDPHATSPTFDAFIKRIMPDDRTRTYLQTALGYSMTAHTKERAMFIAQGGGSNGKSSLLNTVAKIIGDYSQQTDPQTFLQKPRGAINNDVARLNGPRMVLASEVEQDKTLSESVVKNLTGGSDVVVARFLYGEPFEFEPKFKPWLMTNPLPQVKGKDDAIWNRLKLIPFSVVIPLAEQDKELPQKLEDEASGIFNWLLEGVDRWYKRGLGVESPAMIRALSGHRKDQDAVLRFIEEKCHLYEGASVEIDKFFARLKAWADDAGEQVSARGAVRTRLVDLGFPKRGRNHEGLSFDPPDDSAPPPSAPPPTDDVVDNAEKAEVDVGADSVVGVHGASGTSSLAYPTAELQKGRVSVQDTISGAGDVGDDVGDGVASKPCSLVEGPGVPRGTDIDAAEQVDAASSDQSDPGSLVVETADTKKETIIDVNPRGMRSGAVVGAGVAGPDTEQPTRSLVAVDIETTGLDAETDELRVLAFRFPDSEPAAIDARRCPETFRAKLKEIEQHDLVFHNAQFDLQFLEKYGFEPQGRIWDTMVMSQLAYAGMRGENNARLRHSLEACCEREGIEYDADKSNQTSDWNAERLTVEQMEYAQEDVKHLAALLDRITERCASEERIALLESDLTPVCARMGSRGVRVDTDGWLDVAKDVEEELSGVELELDAYGRESVRRLGGGDWEPEYEPDSEYKWTSHKDVALVAADIGLPLPNTKDDTLAASAGHPFIDLIREHRRLSKLRSSYGVEWLRNAPDGIVKARWKQTGTDTGRMSCADPNMQQLPRGGRYRSLVSARPGHKFVVCDYSQIELRIAAKISHDQNMLDAYRRGEDLHKVTARAILGKQEVTKNDRQLAKAVNFGLLYGMGAPKLRIYAKTEYGVDLTLEEAYEYRATWLRTYPWIKAWHRKAGDTLRKSAHADTTTLAGRVRKRVAHYSELLNSPVQGSGADGLKAALVRAAREELNPVLVVHDEIVIEVPEDEAEESRTRLEQIMIDEMDAYVNHKGEHVPIEVESEICDVWEKP